MRNNFACGSLRPYLNLADVSFPPDWDVLLERRVPREVEIGFGTGEYICRLAQQSPGRDYIGLEQCAGRILKTLRKIHAERLGNIRLVQMDAAWAFRFLFAPESLDAVHSLFPCPWPKKRHVRHRLFNPDFIALVYTRLRPGGALRVVTDHRPYADWIEECLVERPHFLPRRRQIPALHGTKFERKWQAAGQQMFEELVFERAADFSQLPRQETERAQMKTYFLERIDPRKVNFTGLSGEVSVQFRDYMFDESAQRGMVQAIVTQEGRTQYLWVLVTYTAKGWCIRPAPGMCILPTEAAQTALQLAASAFEESART